MFRESKGLVLNDVEQCCYTIDHLVLLIFSTITMQSLEYNLRKLIQLVEQFFE